MNPVALAIHGGAGEASNFLKKHQKEYHESLEKIVKEGHQLLKKGTSALDAVETCVKALEDNPLFNAGRGSVLNNLGEIEMDASIMDGQTLKAGAVSMVRNVKNPVSLARKIMNQTPHVLLSGYGALQAAEQFHEELREDDYFITEYQQQQFIEERNKESLRKGKKHGTVGAVALDMYGNIAAATSTGGTSHSLPGRIGDSCIIGAGCYANNNNCAVSGTGEGEALITGVISNTIALLVELAHFSLQDACEHVLHKRNKGKEIGVIAVNTAGEIGISFNTEIMKAAWIDHSGDVHVNVLDHCKIAF